MPARALLVPLLLLVAGCVAPGLQSAGLEPGQPLRVVDDAGAPVPYAAFTLLARDAVVLRGSTDAAGALQLPALAFDRALFAAPGHAPRALAASELAGEVVLARAEAAADPLDAEPVLRLLPPHDFAPYALGPEALCEHRNTCGLSEPVVETAPGGVVYASSTCCIGGSPPVWVSRDGGASWDDLVTPGVREATGIEGDLAVDAAGNVYFTDILVGAMWITSWDAEGNWRHTTPVPFQPLVDRPWVRAGAEDVVYFLYNTAVDGTNFHVSTDGGRTFLPTPLQKFPAPLGTLAQGPELDDLWVVAGMELYASTDGGATWSDGEPVPLPAERPDDAGNFLFAVPAVDPVGRVAVAYDLGTSDDGYAIHVAVREPDGAWNVRDVTARATHVMPWIESGPAGGFLVGWYGVDAEAAGPESVADDAPWHAYLAATHDAGLTWQVARADPEPVLYGPMARRLLDFVQVDLDEQGAAHYVYAHDRGEGRAEVTSYVRSTVGLGLPQLAPLQAGGAPGSPLDLAQRPLGSYEMARVAAT